MPVGSTLFSLAFANTHGVGEALHSYPPGYAQRLNSLAPPQVDLELAVTRSHMNEISPYDITQITWALMETKLEQVQDITCPCDITNYDLFPWWVWLANRGHLSLVSNTGIRHVWVVVAAPLGTGKGKKKGKAEHTKHIIVESEDGIWMTRPGDKRFKEISRNQFQRYIAGQQ